MKKLFISLMAVLFSAYVVAADKAIARITITGTTSGGSAQITLIENDNYSAGYDNGYDAPCNINLAEDLPKTLHIYSYIGANKYSTIATNNLDGLHVDFITNLLDDEYTMTFEVFTLAPGRTLDIYDLDEHVRTDIDPSESHTFTATKGHNEIKDRFIINYVAPSVQLFNEWDDNWATALNFTDNNDGTASASKTFTGNGYCPFKIVEDGNWLGNGNAFKRDYTSATGINNNDANMTLWVDVPGEYTFTWNYETNALSITMPALPTVQMKGSWDSWADFVDFTTAADGLTASANLHLDPADWYNFQMIIADEWRGFTWVDDNSNFTRTNNSHDWINAGTSADMNLHADVAGDYTFTWTYVENKLTITFPAAPVPTCTTVRSGMTAGNYYTICLPKAVTTANGASFWNMSKRGAGVAYLEEAELPLVAGCPYIIQAEAEELCVEYSGDEVAAGTYGALHGTLVAMNQAALDAAGADIYLLKNNELRLVSNQSGNSLAANRAYIKYGDFVVSTPNPAPGRRVRAIPMQDQSTTGVENLNAAEAPVKTVIDGKMYILRGEHMFDATGRMVK